VVTPEVIEIARRNEDAISGKVVDRKAGLEYRITIVFTSDHFAWHVGRPARDRREFEHWGQYLKKGLDWCYVDWELSCLQKRVNGFQEQ